MLEEGLKKWLIGLLLGGSFLLPISFDLGGIEEEDSSELWFSGGKSASVNEGDREGRLD